MKIEKQVIGDILILSFKGKILIGDGVGELRSAVNSAIDEGFTKIIFVMENVPYLDSVGLGELVRSLTSILKAGGKLIICCLSPKVKTLLTVTKLITSFFSVKDTLESAIEEFREGPTKENGIVNHDTGLS